MYVKYCVITSLEIWIAFNRVSAWRALGFATRRAENHRGWSASESEQKRALPGGDSLSPRAGVVCKHGGPGRAALSVWHLLF